MVRIARRFSTEASIVQLPSHHDPYYGEAIGVKFALPKLFKHPLRGFYDDLSRYETS